MYSYTKEVNYCLEISHIYFRKRDDCFWEEENYFYVMAADSENFSSKMEEKFEGKFIMRREVQNQKKN